LRKTSKRKEERGNHGGYRVRKGMTKGREYERAWPEERQCLAVPIENVRKEEDVLGTSRGMDGLKEASKSRERTFYSNSLTRKPSAKKGRPPAEKSKNYTRKKNSVNMDRCAPFSREQKRQQCEARSGPLRPWVDSENEPHKKKPNKK